MGKLFLLFTIVPFVELYLLILLGRVFGAVPTILLVLGTGFVGAALARSEGMRVVRKWQTAVAEGRVPDEGVLSGILVLVGGVLLITPGVLTDMAGLLLLFPSTRIVVADIMRRHLEKKIREGSVHVWTAGGVDSPFGPGAPGGPSAPRGGASEVIDVEGEDVTGEAEVEPPRSLSDGT